MCNFQPAHPDAASPNLPDKEPVEAAALQKDLPSQMNVAPCPSPLVFEEAIQEVKLFYLIYF